ASSKWPPSDPARPAPLNQKAIRAIHLVARRRISSLLRPRPGPSRALLSSPFVHSEPRSAPNRPVTSAVTVIGLTSRSRILPSTYGARYALRGVQRIQTCNMGFQSYCLPYHNDERKKLILKAIKDHNEADWEDESVEVGEQLDGIRDARIKSKRGGCNCAFVGCILCYHGGRRQYTFQWFEDRGIVAFAGSGNPYELVPEEEWVEIKDL
ncbi:hypothetical protein ACHAWF_002275, partial [Thalassiosira exigua]